jgi:AcrR family transcriptional regulator
MTLRSIAYCSTADPVMAPADVADLTTAARARNAENQITGSLCLLWGQFVQVIEGPAPAVARLYDKIACDKRHRKLVVLLDHEIDARWFPDFAMECRMVDGLSEREQSRLGSTLKLATSGAVSKESGYAIVETIAGISPDWVNQRLRSPPQQPRAFAAIDRMLDSARRLGIERGIDNVTVDAVAKDAGISKPGAYRYFATPEALMVALVRRVQARRFAQMRVILDRTWFESDAQLAESMVSAALGAYLGSLTDPGVPRAIALHMLRHYHEIAYDRFWQGAAALRAAMKRCGLPGSDAPLLEAGSRRCAARSPAPSRRSPCRIRRCSAR